MIRSLQQEVGAGRKHCPACDEFKPLDQFSRDSTRPDGLRSWCRACRSKAARIKRKDAARGRLAALESYDTTPLRDSTLRWYHKREMEREERRLWTYEDRTEAVEAAERDWRDDYWLRWYVRSEAARESAKHEGGPDFAAELYREAMDRLAHMGQEAEKGDYMWACEAAIGRAFRTVLARLIDRDE